MNHIDELAMAATDWMRRFRHPTGNFPPMLPVTDSDTEFPLNFRLIVDSIPIPVAIMTPTGEIDAINHPSLEYFGKTPEELKGWPAPDTVYPDDLPRVAAAWRRAVETGQRYEVESRFRGSDGRYRWFHVHGFPLKNGDGHIVRWCALQTDIEDRKQAEIYKAAILDSALDPIVTIDHQGHITEFNPAAERTFGFRREEIVGKLLVDTIVPPALRQKHQSGLARYLATNEAHIIGKRVELTAVRADGEEFPVDLAITRIPLDGPPSFTGYMRDITEHEKAKERLRRSEAFLAESQHITRIGSFSWRVPTDEITWSEQLYRIFEFDQDVPVTLELIRTRVHPEDIPLLDDIVSRVRKSGENFEYEHRLLMPDGSVKYLHLIAHGSRDKDGSLEYIGAAQDVTQRRLSDEALTNARSELTHVTRVTSLGVLTASIAHEINQPLASIITNGEASLRRLMQQAPDVDKIREITMRMVQDARRASEIIDRIRAMITRRVAEPIPLSLNNVIEESMAFLRHEFRSKSVFVSLDLSQELPQVVGDRVQLQQVIVNLVINAIQAMPELGERNILIRTTLSDLEMACCTIEDSGPGIDSTHAPRLFDSFFTTRDTGLGMGLPICRSIIEAHDGEIEADNKSSLGGARFSFALPAKSQA